MKDVGTCATCRAPVWIPDALHESARHSERVKFYCAYGHELHFPQGATEAEKLRRERDRLRQQLAEKDDAIASANRRTEHVEASLRTTKGHVTRIKNRVGHGVCPCCTRSFGNLARHMASEHPTFAAEAAE